MAFLLDETNISFPDPSLSDKDGLLAVGGDLSQERLLLAYTKGIFPWYNEGMPILWWSPGQRMVLFPSQMKVSHSLRQSIRQGTYQVTFDKAFGEVIEACEKTPRLGQDGTWINPEMKRAYLNLFNIGKAHSVEAWQNDKLLGGLYGVSIGKAFFGESMFHQANNASKVAFYHLVERLKSADFELIDAQVHTSHLESLGAQLIPRRIFLSKLKHAISLPEDPDVWR